MKRICLNYYQNKYYYFTWRCKLRIQIAMAAGREGWDKIQEVLVYEMKSVGKLSNQEWKTRIKQQKFDGSWIQQTTLGSSRCGGHGRLTVQLIFLS